MGPNGQTKWPKRAHHLTQMGAPSDQTVTWWDILGTWSAQTGPPWDQTVTPCGQNGRTMWRISQTITRDYIRVFHALPGTRQG